MEITSATGQPELRSITITNEQTNIETQQKKKWSTNEWLRKPWAVGICDAFATFHRQFTNHECRRQRE